MTEHDKIQLAEALKKVVDLETKIKNLSESNHA